MIGNLMADGDMEAEFAASDADLLPISVILPTFGRQDLTLRAIGSVVNQTRRPQEIILVDDGSQPAISLDGVASGSTTIKAVRHERNLGAAAARNSGVRHASGEWITFLDSDDQLAPLSLEARWTTMQTAGAAENIIYGCGWNDVDDGDRILRTRLPRPANRLVQFASGCWYSPGSCILMRRDAFLDAGVWQDESLRRFEDYDWSIQLGLQGFSLQILPVIGAAIRRHRGQQPAMVEDVARRILGKWRELKLPGACLRRTEAYLSLECAAANYHAGRPIRTAAWLGRSFIASPRLSLQLSPGWSRPPNG